MEGYFPVEKASSLSNGYRFISMLKEKQLANDSQNFTTHQYYNDEPRHDYYKDVGPGITVM